MEKPNIEEWAQDCKEIGIAARRFCYATRGLSEDEAHGQHDKMVEAAQAFANKYGIDLHLAQKIAYTISDSVNLGLGY